MGLNSIIPFAILRTPAYTRAPLHFAPKILYKAAVNNRNPADQDCSSDIDLKIVSLRPEEKGEHSPQNIESYRSIGDMSNV
jgi:hypothetical protein